MPKERRPDIMDGWFGDRSISDPIPKAERDLVELYRQYKPQIIKRATFLLNPLDGHPLFYGNDTRMDMAGTQAFSGVVTRELNRQAGLLAAEAAHRTEQKHPGRIRKRAREKAYRGYTMLEGILPECMDKHATKPRGFADMPYRNSLFQFIDNDLVRATLGLVQEVASELAEPMQSGGKKRKRTYGIRDAKHVFAVMVGFAQTVIEHEAEVQNDRKRKHVIRDQVLLFCMSTFRSAGHTGLVEYIAAQKAMQPPTRKNK